MERLFQQSPVVLLSGDTGAGKTELALGISHWSQRTLREQLSGGVFYSTFEASHPAGLERIIHEIGTSAAGLEFADMNARQQRLWVLEYLQKRPSLLVWDNVQNVAGDAEREGSGLLTEDEQTELNEFITQVTQAASGQPAFVGKPTSFPALAYRSVSTTDAGRPAGARPAGIGRQNLGKSCHRFGPGDPRCPGFAGPAGGSSPGNADRLTPVERGTRFGFAGGGRPGHRGNAREYPRESQRRGTARLSDGGDGILLE